MQNKIYIQAHNNVKLSLFWIFFIKFYSFCNNDLQVTNIQKEKV